MNPDTAQLLLSQNKKTYNSIAQNFSQTRNRIWPELDFFIKNYIKDGYDILDVGCGNGRLLGAISENFNNFNYAGIDISEKLIGEASKQFANSKYSPKFSVNDILNLPPDFISGNKFDAVVSIAVLNHIPSKEFRQLALENIFKLLKPNGYLLMTNWNLWNISSKKSWWRLKYPAFSSGSIFSPHRRENIAEHTSQSTLGYCGGTQEKLDFKDIITYWGQEKFPLYYHGFTKNEINKLLQKNGFRVIENFYNLKDKETKWREAENLVTIAQKING